MAGSLLVLKGIMIPIDSLTSPHPTTQNRATTRHGKSLVNKIPIASHKGKQKFKGGLGFVQINLNKQHQATKDLGSYICNMEKPMILVQEPHVSGKGVISKGSYCLKAAAIRTPGLPIRASIFFHKSMERQIWIKDSITTEDCAAVQTKVNGVETLVVSCYMDGCEEQCPSQAFKNSVEHAKKHNLALIIGTDANAHNTAWNSRICDQKRKERGDKLLEYILANNLFIENTGNTPTFDNGRWKNSIDLTITNQSGRNLVEGWRVDVKDRVEHSSDHNYIVFKSTGATELVRQNFRDISKTDWEVYEADLDRRISEKADMFKDISTIDRLDTAAEALSSSVLDAFNSATELTYVSAKVKPPPWDTPEVKNARKDMRTKIRLASRSKNKHMDSKLDDLKRVSRKKYEKLRDHTWSVKYKEFCEKLEAKADSKRISSLIKANKDTKLGAVRKTDGTLTENPTETLEQMTEVHFGNQAPPAPSTESQPDGAGQGAAPRWGVNHVFSRNRVKRALQEFSPLTAAGPDGIRPIMLQKGWGSIGDAFTSIAIASYQLSHTPSSWRNSAGVFLPKPGKDDYHNPKSYRTISLSPVFLKWMERIVLWHMEADLKVHEKLSKKQYGFKRGSSTTAAIHKLVRKLEMAILNKGMALGTFLDIEGAFDNVSFEAIDKALTKNCRSNEVNRWIMSMIRGRQTTVELQGKKRVISIRRGCPQGGILSPFLWNLVINDLLEYTRDKIPCDLQGFADDISLVSVVTAPKKPSGHNCQGFDTDTLREVTQKSLNSINQWCKANGLNLSQLKTHCVMFTNRRNCTFSKPLKVDGMEIELKTSTKFLGITLDSKLSWNEHIVAVCKKSKNILMQCRRAVGPTWGFKPKTMRWIYEVMVRPILSYGATIWINGTHKKHNQQLLMGVQRLANVLSTGAMPSTPSAALNVITGFPPITMWLSEAAAKETLRLKCHGHWEFPPPGKPSVRLKSHICTNEKTIKALPRDIVSTELDLITPSLSIDQHFTVDIPDRSSYSELAGEDFDVVCYTDGSRMNDHTGAGMMICGGPQLVHLDHREAFYLGKHSTVFQAEVFAVGKAADHLLGNKLRERKILINCDSKSAIQSIDSTVIRNRTSLTATTTLNSLGINNEVTLRWIPAHSGYEGNEIADQLAKAGSSNDNNSATCVLLPVPRSICYAALRSKTKEDWKISYKSKPPRTFDMFWRDRFAKELSKMSRRDLRVATQLLTGHAALNYHLKKVNPTVSTTCPLCQAEDETVSHFLGGCPSLGSIRAEYFDTYLCTATEVFDRYSISKIVSYAHRTKRLDPRETGNDRH